MALVKISKSVEKVIEKVMGKGAKAAANTAEEAVKVAAHNGRRLGKVFVGAKKITLKEAKQRVQVGDFLGRAKKANARYTSIRFQGTTKVGGEVKDISRRVYQRNDIDWNRIDPGTGLTNAQLAKKGRPPYWNDGTKIELHHLIQREPGSMVEIPASLHDKYTKVLHGLVENGGSFRNNSTLEKQYNNFRTQYWKWRAGQL